MKSLIIAFMLHSSFFHFAHAEGPATQVKELNLSLEYLSLTPSEIKARDALLRPIYDNYENTTISSVANALERAYGMNVYHHFIDKKLDLKDKKSVMENAVRYYLGVDGLFNQASPGVVSDKNALNKKIYSNDSVEYPKMSLKLITGNKSHWNDSIDTKSPSLLTSKISEENIEDFIFNSKIGTRRALYSTASNRLFTAPTMNDFLEAMRNLNIKGLDATVTFLKGAIFKEPLRSYEWSDDERRETVKYRVVYPMHSKIAPIPQPTIFVAEDANYQDIVEMLTENAPKIYAYNKLFNKNLLPSLNEINEILNKYPNIYEEVIRARGGVTRDNLINAIQSAFLNVTYGAAVGTATIATAVIAAPLSLAAIVVSPILSPIFISTVIVCL
ncbi:MAG: hypothetical protein KBD76_13145 [Bacteriovorax sp.]|nr:hypothetical protein [Bacteriovorax sp.]